MASHHLASTDEAKAHLYTLLNQGRATSLEEVRNLIESHTEVLNVGFQGSALLNAIQNNCPDEVVLYILYATFPRDNENSQQQQSTPTKSNNNNNNNRKECLLWKLVLLACLDAARGTSHRVVWEVLETFPQWVDSYDFCKPCGHLFCWALVLRPDIAREMIHRYPQLAQPNADKTYVPLHSATKLRDRATVEVILQAYPPGIEVRDGEGLLPLHHALSSDPRMDMDLFQYLADRMPSTTFFHDVIDEDSGHLFLHQVALHSSIKFCMADRMVQAVIDRNPSALMTPDLQGCLPIHLALEDQNEAYGFIKRLLDAAPESALVPNRNGHLPMHVAASKYMVASLQDLIDQHPQAIVHRDPQGQTPLHIMLDADMFDKHSAQRMIQIHPELLLMKDNAGKVPLHYAVGDCQYFEEHDWLELVELLTQACPEAGQIRDANGKTPLHYATATGMPIRVMEALLHHCARAVWIPDQEGNIPLCYAATTIHNPHPLHCRLSTLFSLVRHDPAKLFAMHQSQPQEQEQQVKEEEEPRKQTSSLPEEESLFTATRKRKRET